MEHDNHHVISLEFEYGMSREAAYDIIGRATAMIIGSVVDGTSITPFEVASVMVQEATRILCDNHLHDDAQAVAFAALIMATDLQKADTQGVRH